jgi:hypothetical protein
VTGSDSGKSRESVGKETVKMIDVSRHVQIGQTVHLEELNWGYRITLVAPEESGHKVVDIGVDYLVLDDAAAGVKLRIPGHLIRPVDAPLETAPRAA